MRTVNPDTVVRYTGSGRRGGGGRSSVKALIIGTNPQNLLRFTVAATQWICQKAGVDYDEIVAKGTAKERPSIGAVLVLDHDEQDNLTDPTYGSICVREGERHWAQGEEPNLPLNWTSSKESPTLYASGKGLLSLSRTYVAESTVIDTEWDDEHAEVRFDFGDLDTGTLRTYVDEEVYDTVEGLNKDEFRRISAKFGGEIADALNEAEDADEGADG